MLFGKDADKKEADKKAADKKTIMIKMCLFVALGALLSLLLMFPARGIMNAVSRLDYISQRLDDYLFPAAPRPSKEMRRTIPIF